MDWKQHCKIPSHSSPARRSTWAIRPSLFYRLIFLRFLCSFSYTFHLYEFIEANGWTLLMIECLDFDLGMWFIHIWIGRSDASLFCFSISFFLGFFTFCLYFTIFFVEWFACDDYIIFDRSANFVYLCWKKLSWTRTVWGIFFALFCFHFVFVYVLFFLGVMRQFINSYPCLIYGCWRFVIWPNSQIYFLHKSKIDIAFLKEKKWFCFLCFLKNWDAFSWFFTCFGMRRGIRLAVSNFEH